MAISNQVIIDWLDEIEDAKKKREKDFRKNGKRIQEIYNGDKPDQIPFNILYSNTETLRPALYSQTPRPVVKRRFNQEESPLITAVEKSGTRILEYFLDTNIEGYESFDDSMGCAVLDAALPGRGITQIKFDAVFEDKDEEKLKWAFVCADSKKWDRVTFGYANKWADVPWVAFEDYLDKEECLKLFDADVVKEMTFTENEDDSDREDDPSEHSNRKTAIVFQIWEKSSKTVKWISETYDDYLKEQDDPLEITGFFPVPKPLMLHAKSNDLTPTALYTMYENQAKELNRITTRLNRVFEAIKCRGVYDGELGDELEKIMDEDDNALIPTDKGASLVEGGFDKSIWFLPIEKLITVAQMLIEAREQAKRVIYEITGLSDILRGNSKASETLGAQKIKESWGTMRLKTMQREVQFYVRDSMRIMLDVASTKIPLRFWGKLTGLTYPTNEERKKAQTELTQMQQKIQQVMQQAEQQGQMQAQQTGQPPQPIKPPPPPPPELLELANSPSWEEILDVLKDDFIRSFKIDIETNSTLDIEATEDQKQVGEFMNAFAQFMNGIQPMVDKGTMPFEAAQSMMLEITRRYRFGIDVEEQLKKMKPPKMPDPEAFKKQQEEAQKKMQAEQQKLQQKGEQLQKQEQQLKDQQQKAGDDLDAQANQLQADKMQFAFDKKLFEEKTKMEKVLDNELDKLKEQKMMQDVNNEHLDIKRDMEEISDKTKRDMQSMLDKAVSCVEKANEPRTVQS